MREFNNIPERIAKLPRDKRGYPVPWFVTWIDGEPDFRITEAKRAFEAHKLQKCWICGEKLGVYKTFVIGPMCAINRVSAEPPCHKECAEFAARACPFLAQPKMKRNEKGLPEEREEVGHMIKRNPGVTLVWTTKRYRMFPVYGGFLFNVGDPENMEWYAEGKEATHKQVMESFATGCPILEAEAKKDGESAIQQYEKMKEDAMRLVGKVFPENCPTCGEVVRNVFEHVDQDCAA